MGKGHQEPAFLHSSAQGQSCIFMWPVRPLIPAPNLGSFLLCDFLLSDQYKILKLNHD